MPDYGKLRQMVSHRVTFEYDTGAKVVGYVAGCRPATGPVQLVQLSKVNVLDQAGTVLESFDALAVVPNALVGVRVADGPRGRDA